MKPSLISFNLSGLKNQDHPQLPVQKFVVQDYTQESNQLTFNAKLVVDTVRVNRVQEGMNFRLFVRTLLG